jgi:lipid II:glycine glycyltransferase (peptidoglycan interpeptide bridge formation enzyme)
MDVRQSEEYADYLKRSGWLVKRIGGINYFIKKFPIIGSILKVQRVDFVSVKNIKKLCKKHRVFQVIVEPNYWNNYLDDKDFKLSKSPYLPTKTLWLDLKRTKSKLLRKMKKDCRQALERTSSLDINKVDDFKGFRESWRNAVGWKFFVPSQNSLNVLVSSFKGKCAVFGFGSNLKRNTYNAGAVFLCTNDRAYYWSAFTNEQGRKDLAQYRLVWEGILWAKKKDVEVFDFEGVFDERFPIKSWKGFSHFKKSFGGCEIGYPGAFTKFLFRG